MSKDANETDSPVSDELLAELKQEFRSLTVEQLADVMGLERWRVYEMIKRGEAPPHLKVGSTYRFPVARFRAWMAETTLSS